MKTKIKRKIAQLRGKKRLIGILGAVFFAIALATGSTFAWYMATDTEVNKFRNRQVGNVVITEEFVPPKNWIPGQEVKKEVWAQNQSKYEVLVRIGFEELLTKYDGPITTMGEPWSPEARLGSPWNNPADAYQTTPVLLDFIPSAKYPSPVWTDLPISPTDPNLAVHPDVLKLFADWPDLHILMRKMEVTPEVLPTPPPSPPPQDASTGYEFVAWYEIPSGGTPNPYIGEAQKVRVDLYVTEDPANSKTPTIMLSGAPQFYCYPPLVSSSGAWANLMQKQLTSYTKPIVHPAATAVTHSDLDPDILFDFLTNLADPPVAGKWYYNPEDGFFYYIGKLTPAGTTGALSEMLLASVTLDKGADTSHADMQYSLLVNSEAIQNYETAMTSPNGWNMTPGPVTDAIIAELRSAGAFAIP